VDRGPACSPASTKSGRSPAHAVRVRCA
jgi:hypothetical protein